MQLRPRLLGLTGEPRTRPVGRLERDPCLIRRRRGLAVAGGGRLPLAGAYVQRGEIQRRVAVRPAGVVRQGWRQGLVKGLGRLDGLGELSAYGREAGEPFLQHSGGPRQLFLRLAPCRPGGVEQRRADRQRKGRDGLLADRAGVPDAEVWPQVGRGRSGPELVQVGPCCVAFAGALRHGRTGGLDPRRGVLRGVLECGGSVRRRSVGLDRPPQRRRLTSFREIIENRLSLDQLAVGAQLRDRRLLTERGGRDRACAELGDPIRSPHLTQRADPCRQSAKRGGRGVSARRGVPML